MNATGYVAAVLARLGTEPKLTVLDGDVHDTPAGAYVVLYDEPFTRRRGRLSSTSDRQTWTVRLVCVGRDANECRFATRRVDDLLTDWRVPGADPSMSPLMRSSVGELLRDPDVANDVRFSQTLTFTATSNRS